MTIEEEEIGSDDDHADIPRIAATVHELVKCMSLSETRRRQASNIWDVKATARCGSTDLGQTHRLQKDKDEDEDGEGFNEKMCATFRRSLNKIEAEVGLDNLHVAIMLQSQANIIVYDQKDEAESVLRRSLTIKEAKLGPDDVRTSWKVLHSFVLGGNRLRREKACIAAR